MLNVKFYLHRNIEYVATKRNHHCLNGGAVVIVDILTVLGSYFFATLV